MPTRIMSCRLPVEPRDGRDHDAERARNRPGEDATARRGREALSGEPDLQAAAAVRLTDVVWQGLAALGLEGLGDVDLGHAIETERAEVEPQLAPGEHQPDGAIEEEGERPHCALGQLALRIGVREADL